MNDATELICRQIINKFDSLTDNIDVVSVKLDFTMKQVKYELYNDKTKEWISDREIRSDYVSQRGAYSDGILELFKLYNQLQWSVYRKELYESRQFKCEIHKRETNHTVVENYRRVLRITAFFQNGR